MPARSNAKPQAEAVAKPTRRTRTSDAKDAALKSGASKQARSGLAAPASEPRPHATIGTLVIYDEDEPLPRTKLTETDLSEFKESLLARRKELIGDVGNLTGEALGRNRQEATGDLSSMPIHMADLGSDNWEQEFTLGLIDNSRKLLREIDDALQRIEDRTYGVCMATHKPISKARLRAKPWANYCIEYAKLREAGHVPR